MFSPGEFLLEYPAELVTYEEALEREKEYETSNKECFIYFLEDLLPKNLYLLSYD